MNHSELVKRSLLEVGAEPDCRLWVNETFGAWVGQGQRLKNGDVLVKQAHFVQGGLCEGSSDIIGIGPGGTFFAPEIKTGRSRLSKAQRNFKTIVEQLGGYAPTIRSTDEIREALEHLRRQQ